MLNRLNATLNSTFKMTKPTLFDEDSEDEVAIKTENEYAKRYDAWREKEELHKCENIFLIYTILEIEYR